MDISAKKLELMQLLLQEQKEGVLLKIEKIFKKEDAEKTETDWYLDLSDEERVSLQRGIEDADNEKLIPHKEVMKKFDKYQI